MNQQIYLSCVGNVNVATATLLHILHWSRDLDSYFQKKIVNCGRRITNLISFNSSRLQEGCEKKFFANKCDGKVILGLSRTKVSLLSHNLFLQLLIWQI